MANFTKLGLYDTFTMQDVADKGPIRFWYTGSSDYYSTLGLKASDGVSVVDLRTPDAVWATIKTQTGFPQNIPDSYRDGAFIQIAPSNDAPNAVEVRQPILVAIGQNTLINGSNLYITDPDSRDRLTGLPGVPQGSGSPTADPDYSAPNTLTVRIISLPTHGTLQVLVAGVWQNVTGQTDILKSEILAGHLRYVHSGDSSTSDTFTVRAQDNWNATSANTSVTIDVYRQTSLQALPRMSLPGTVPATEDAFRSVVFSNARGSAISLAEANPNGAFTMTVNAPAGALYAVLGTGAQVNGYGTSSLVISGTRDQVDAALNGLTYLPPNSAAYANTSVSLQLQLTDSSSGTGITITKSLQVALGATSNNTALTWWYGQRMGQENASTHVAVEPGLPYGLWGHLVHAKELSGALATGELIGTYTEGRTPLTSVSSLLDQPLTVDVQYKTSGLLTLGQTEYQPLIVQAPEAPAADVRLASPAAPSPEAAVASSQPEGDQVRALDSGEHGTVDQARTLAVNYADGAGVMAGLSSQLQATGGYGLLEQAKELLTVLQDSEASL